MKVNKCPKSLFPCNTYQVWTLIFNVLSDSGVFWVGFGRSLHSIVSWYYSFASIQQERRISCANKHHTLTTVRAIRQNIVYDHDTYILNIIPSPQLEPSDKISHTIMMLTLSYFIDYCTSIIMTEKLIPITTVIVQFFFDN